MLPSSESIEIGMGREVRKIRITEETLNVHRSSKTVNKRLISAVFNILVLFSTALSWKTGYTTNFLIYSLYIAIDLVAEPRM